MLRNQCSCYILLKRRTDGEANGSRQILKIARAIQYILFKKLLTFSIQTEFTSDPTSIRRGQFSNKKSCSQRINPSIMWYMLYYRIFLISPPPSPQTKSKNKIEQKKIIFTIYHIVFIFNYLWPFIKNKQNIQ